MIRASELRLNNWVNITGTQIQLTGEKFLYILAEDGLITRCEGVALTPEILEKAGFRKEGNCFSHRNVDIPCYKTFTGIDMLLVPNPKYAMDVRHVHQLQNLYFALTGEELEINL